MHLSLGKKGPQGERDRQARRTFRQTGSESLKKQQRNRYDGKGDPVGVVRCRPPAGTPPPAGLRQQRTGVSSPKALKEEGVTHPINS